MTDSGALVRPARRRFRARNCGQCALRFPVEHNSPLGESCPVCGANTQFVGDPYETQGADCRPAGALELDVLLDNVRSIRNVGAVFRCADGAGVRHLHLCGFTPTPEHPKLAKTALGAERVVAWTRHPNAVAAVRDLVESGSRLWVVEGSGRAQSVFAPQVLADRHTGPVVLALGHEVSGVDPEVAKLATRTICLPMLGTKGSLNVSVAMAIAAYVMRFSRG